MNVLAIDQRLLDEARRKQETPKDAADAKRKAKSQQSRLTSMQRRLGDQWFAVGHPVNGLENWRTNDDLDIARFAIEKARREATAKAPPSKDEEKKVDPPEPKKPVTAVKGFFIARFRCLYLMQMANYCCSNAATKNGFGPYTGLIAAAVILVSAKP